MCCHMDCGAEKAQVKFNSADNSYQMIHHTKTNSCSITLSTDEIFTILDNINDYLDRYISETLESFTYDDDEYSGPQLGNIRYDTLDLKQDKFNVSEMIDSNFDIRKIFLSLEKYQGKKYKI